MLLRIVHILSQHPNCNFNPRGEGLEKLMQLYFFKPEGGEVGKADATVFFKPEGGEVGPVNINTKTHCQLADGGRRASRSAKYYLRYI